MDISEVSVEARMKRAGYILVRTFGGDEDINLQALGHHDNSLDHVHRLCTGSMEFRRLGGNGFFTGLFNDILDRPAKVYFDKAAEEIGWVHQVCVGNEAVCNVSMVMTWQRKSLDRFAPL